MNITDEQFEQLLAERAKRLRLDMLVPLSADSERGEMKVYVEQGASGCDMADLAVGHGSSFFKVCFLKAADLDRIAEFLTVAARQLRRHS